jgi:hypothetical protein
MFLKILRIVTYLCLKIHFNINSIKKKKNQWQD